MKRLVLAAAAALTLSACCALRQPSTPADPWAALQPWNHARADVQKLPRRRRVRRRPQGRRQRPQPRPARRMVEVKYEGRLADAPA